MCARSLKNVRRQATNAKTTQVDFPVETAETLSFGMTNLRAVRLKLKSEQQQK